MTDSEPWMKSLRRLEVPPPGATAIERIVAAATPRSPGFLAMIVLPRPAFGLAICLAFGLLMGWQASGAGLNLLADAPVSVDSAYILDTFNATGGHLL